MGAQQRRQPDCRASQLVRRLAQRARADSVLAGRVLLFASGLVTTGTVGLLHPDAYAWLVFLGVSIVMAALLALSILVPWAKLPAWAPVAFPITVWVALAAIGLLGDGLAAPFTGLSVLCFGYLGFTQPVIVSRLCLPVSALSLIAAYGHWSAQLGPRLLIALAVWAAVSEVTAGFVREHAELTDALRRAAHVDVLTGLANRRDLGLRLATAGPGDCVVLCDIDHFKQINDSRGHSAGDRILADFGTLLRSALRADDYPARFGGEEFALILPATTVDQARPILARLRRQWNVLHPDVTFSSGLAALTTDRSNDESLAAADAALYVSKNAGRNCDHAEGVATALGALEATGTR